MLHYVSMAGNKSAARLRGGCTVASVASTCFFRLKLTRVTKSRAVLFKSALQCKTSEIKKVQGGSTSSLGCACWMMLLLLVQSRSRKMLAMSCNHVFALLKAEMK